MNKRFISIIVSLCVFLSVFAFGNAENEIKVTFNGNLLNFEVPPTIIKGNTMLPLRAIFEAFGTTVDWNGSERKVKSTKGSTVIELQIDNKIAKVNSKDVELEVPGTLVNGSTMVPARFIAESFGAKVDWNAATRTVAITYLENGVAENSVKELLKPVSAGGFPKGVHGVILPRVELLSGVLSQTSWMQTRGPKGNGNKYFRELKEFFSKYNGHKAVQIAEMLTKNGFSYDAPPNFILSLKELPDLQPEGEYSEYLITRAKGKQNLEEFAAALADLSKEMDFPSFFEAHRIEFQSYVDQSLRGFDAAKVINWMQGFYGEVDEKGDFYIVFAPAMFPQGGYAASIQRPDGKNNVYQVIREFGSSENEVQFSSGKDIELLALHEWGHTYVNPSVESYSYLFEEKQISKLYMPVKEIMAKQAYGRIETFLNEQVLRSAVAVAAKELYGETIYENILKREKQNGFYLTDFTVEQLEYYQKNKSQYKSFKDFIPYLLEQYNRNIESLLAQVPK